MKKSHIVLLVLIAAAVCIIVSMFGDFSTYETFSSAAEHPEKQKIVIGVLAKDKAMHYDPLTDPNHFTFFCRGQSRKCTQSNIQRC